MNEIINYFSQHKLEIILIIFGIILLAYMITHWEKVKFTWLNISYSFPLFGKISRLSKDIDGFDEKHKWFYSEERLCRDYYNFYEKVDKDDESYDASKSYLHAAGELGRKPTPMLIWIMILSLVVIEAFGFSYVLAGFTIPGASEDTQQKGAIGVAAMLAILLVWLTHLTGEEIHKNSLIKKIRRWYKNDNSSGTNKRDLKPDPMMVTIDTTENDKESPDYIRMLNRLDINSKIKTSYLKTSVTLFFVGVVAIGATYIRGQVLERDLADMHGAAISIFDKNKSPFGDTEQTNSKEIENMFGKPSGDTDNELSDIFGGDQVKKSAEKNKVDTDSTEEQTNRRGGWATFGILGLLFVFIQILGIFFGMHWGFVGRESKDAYDSLKGFSTQKAYLNYYEKIKNNIARVAQEKLQTLQHKMNLINDNEGTDAETTLILRNNKERTFNRYLEFEDR